MAKYTISYACGHGSYEEQLFGQGKERERRIEWLERNKICPECYRAKMQAQAKSEIVTAELIYNAFSGGAYLAITKGDTYSIKEALKAAGCKWGEYIPQGDILGMSRPRKAWMIKIPDDITDDAEAITAIIRKLMDAGVQTVRVDNSPLASMAMQVARNLNAKKEVA